MLIDIVNKILILLFVLGGLNILRHIYFVIQASFLKNKYRLSSRALLLLGISLAYVITSLFTGITF